MAETNDKTEFTMNDVAFLGGLIEERLPLQNMKEAATVSQTLKRLALYVLQQNNKGSSAEPPAAP